MKEMQELINAVIAVMKSVDNVEKGMTVGSGNYAYQGLSDKDVKMTFKKALSDNGLCVLPIKVEPNTTVSEFEVAGKRKQSVFTEVVSTYLLMHTSGASVEISGVGHGVDAGDKAAGKATTYALKNALMYSFLTPSGAIDDADNTHSNDLGGNSAPAAPAPKKKAKAKLAPRDTDRWSKAVELAKTKGVDAVTKHFLMIPADLNRLKKEAGIV